MLNTRTLPLYLAALWLLGASSARASGSDGGCAELIAAKKYEAAAGCLLGRFQATKGAATGPARVASGRRLRNAAVAFHRAASQTREAGPRSYLFERAVATLGLYLKGRWYENKYRKRRTELLRRRWRDEIGYTPLTLVPRQPGLSYGLKGYRFSKRLKGPWSQAVRPGKYALRFAVGGEAKVLEFRVLAGKPHILTFGPKPALRVKPPSRRRLVVARKPPVPTAPARNPALAILGWTSAGLALAALATGVAFYAVARGAEGQKATLYQELKADPLAKTPDDTLRLFRLDSQARTFQPIGVALGIGGAVLGATSALLFALHASPRANPPQAPRQPDRGQVIRLLAGQTF